LKIGQSAIDTKLLRAYGLAQEINLEQDDSRQENSMTEKKPTASSLDSRREFLQLLGGSIGALTGMTYPAMASQGSNQETGPLYESGSGDVALALTGDSMISRSLMLYREERFLKLRDILLGADVRFTNGEILFHNYENSPTYYTRTYMRCDPRLIKDLQWLGFNLMSCANNHGIDYGEGGVLTNIRNLDEAGMVHAGSGSNYAEALAPAYLETPKGRVALLSATSSGRANSRAGEQRRDMKGRPGVNLIRWINEWTVDKETFDAFTRAAKQFGWQPGGESATRAAASDPNTILLHDYALEKEKSARAVYFSDRNDLAVGSEDPAARFVLGESFERHTRINEPDFRRNLQSVSDARRMADWVIYSVHNHEGGKSIEEPSEHMQILARAVIDTGADTFVGHGPHLLRGIEIYKGRPIFYSLGSFISENDTVLLEPEDGMVREGLGPENTAADFYDARAASEKPNVRVWQSVIPVASFKSKNLHDIKLYPIEMGYGLPRPDAGRPMLARGKTATDILKRLQHLSEPFHTIIEIQGEVGVIRIG
jgi:poly-gamma-glutamate capsule biosynthesis protein CapA/YwtB (metallophosphatase superfamily)